MRVLSGDQEVAAGMVHVGSGAAMIKIRGRMDIEVNAILNNTQIRMNI